MINYDDYDLVHNSLIYNEGPDLVIVDESGIHEIPIPKYCSVDVLLGYKILQGAYYFEVKQWRRLSLKKNTKGMFSLYVPNDTVRLQLGLDQAMNNMYYSNSCCPRHGSPTIAFPQPTILYHFK